MDYKVLNIICMCLAALGAVVGALDRQAGLIVGSCILWGSSLVALAILNSKDK